jgi:hypothetical protein
MKAIATLTVLVLLLFAAGSALADCVYDGRSYPTGTNIGGVICQPDGTWG